MGETVNIAISASVKAGPELKGAWAADVPSYEKIEIQVDPAGKAVVPLTSPDKIILLVIGVGAGDKAVSYKFAGKDEDGKGKDLGTVSLDQLPRVLVYQKGMVPTEGNSLTLEFDNGGSKPVM